jgi:hypothetical protein
MKIMAHSPNSIPMLLRCYYSPSRERVRAAHAAVAPAEAFHTERATRRRVFDIRLRAGRDGAPERTGTFG